MILINLLPHREAARKRKREAFYAALGVSESRVVRCLLASMPPGMKIPVHHDTGY